jgi:hypothetical protein
MTFAAFLPVFGAVVAWVFWRRWDWTMAALGAVAVTSVVGVVGLTAPERIRTLYLAWNAAVAPIGLCVSQTVTAAVFFGVVTPIGLLRRWTGHDPLGRRHDPAAKTYWQTRAEYDSDDRAFRQS